MVSSTKLVIRGGRVVSPADGVDDRLDVLIDGERVADLGGARSPDAGAVLNADGLIVSPGLIDVHVHLREPGFEHKETIETGTRAAAAGGFTAVVCMPNTQPAMDNAPVLQDVAARARGASCRVFPIGAITLQRAGCEVVDMQALAQAGAVALSDDGDGVEDDAVMLAALRASKAVGLPIVQHCEFKAISAGGVMHQGAVSERLGVAGIDPRAEEAMIERDLALVRETGARYHVAHISTARAVQLVRHAKADGLPVTAEVCTHHLALTDAACHQQDPNTKMHPPLRSASDVQACVAGLLDGTIDCIVTDHAPHTQADKSVGFADAPFGIVGLETSLAVAATVLVGTGRADWSQLIGWMSAAPARVMGLEGGGLAPGRPADVTLIDPSARWTVDAAKLRSKSHNTPFDGWAVTGRPVATLVAGRPMYVDGAYADRMPALADRGWGLEFL